MMTGICSSATVLSHPHNWCLSREKRMMGEMKPQTNSVNYFCDMRAFVSIRYLLFTLLSLWTLHSYYRHHCIQIILPLLLSWSLALQCLSIFLSSLNALQQLQTTSQLQWIRCLGLLSLWISVLKDIWTMNVACSGSRELHVCLEISKVKKIRDN